MPAKITNIKDENGNTLYPVTKTSAVLDANGDNLDILLARKQNSLSSSQMNAVNSGIDSTKVAKIAENTQDIADINTALGNKQDKLSQTQLDAVNSGIDSTKVAKIATNTQDIADINTALGNKQDQLSQTQLDAVNSGATSQFVTINSSWIVRQASGQTYNYINFMDINFGTTNDVLVLLSVHRGGNNAAKYYGQVEIRCRGGSTPFAVTYCNVEWTEISGFASNDIVVVKDANDSKLLHFYINTVASQDYFFKVLDMSSRDKSAVIQIENSSATTVDITSPDYTSISKLAMFESTSYKGRAELYGINADMNIGVGDTTVTNLIERRNNPKINYTLNSAHTGIVVPAGVKQVKITSIMCYLPKSNNENFNNVIKLNGADLPDYQGYIYVQAPIANIRTSLCNIVVLNVNEGDVISFVTKAPATDTSNPAVLQKYNTHFIIETLQTSEEG